MKRARILPTLVAFLMSQGFAPATSILFDFEGLADTHDSGAYSVLSLTEMGLTMTITRLGDVPEHSVFDIGNFTPNTPASWGSSSLDPFHPYVGYPDVIPGRSVFVLDFSSPLNGFSAEFGDLSPSDIDSPVTMVAYDALGGLGPALDVATREWSDTDGFPIGGPTPAPGTISVSGSGIRSVAFSSGGMHSNSLLWDNFRASVPDSSTTVILLGLSLLALGAIKHKTSKD